MKKASKKTARKTARKTSRKLVGRSKMADTKAHVPDRKITRKVLVDGKTHLAKVLIPDHGRRERSVFSNGVQVALEGMKECSCSKHKGVYLPMKEFGMRQMPSGLIRPQARCIGSR